MSRISNAKRELIFIGLAKGWTNNRIVETVKVEEKTVKKYRGLFIRVIFNYNLYKSVDEELEAEIENIL